MCARHMAEGRRGVELLVVLRAGPLFCFPFLIYSAGPFCNALTRVCVYHMDVSLSVCVWFVMSVMRCVG